MKGMTQGWHERMIGRATNTLGMAVLDGRLDIDPKTGRITNLAQIQKPSQREIMAMAIYDREMQRRPERIRARGRLAGGVGNAQDADRQRRLRLMELESKLFQAGEKDPKRRLDRLEQRLRQHA